MTLREKQSVFANLVAKLILQAQTLGYEVTLGEAWRSPEEALRLFNAGMGIKNSLHSKRLAIDLNLFQNGKFLTKTEDYQLLGAWWESQSFPPDISCAWGGRFGDGNHFSIAHGNAK